MARSSETMQNRSVEEQEERPVWVLSQCHAIFRVAHPNERQGKELGSAIFHIPPFPSVQAIDPSERLYEKREELDADIVELLLCIDWKVNLLMKILSPMKEEARYPYRAVIIEMSTRGIKILTPQSLLVGVRLEFHLVLPILPFREMFLQGEVRELLAENPLGDEYEYLLAIDSNLLSESDLEHLIRYIVMRQFQAKREHRQKE